MLNLTLTSVATRYFGGKKFNAASKYNLLHTLRLQKYLMVYLPSGPWQKRPCALHFTASRMFCKSGTGTTEKLLQLAVIGGTLNSSLILNSHFNDNI